MRKERIIARPAHGRSIELVLGGGGVKGFGHIGLLKALLEYRVNVGKITGVSIGAVVAAFYANGYSPDEIEQIFLAEIKALGQSRLRTSLQLPCLRGLLKGGLIDLGELFETIVRKYNLQPRESLCILAYNALKREPVLFAGTNYDLPKAITASCAIPLVMRPVWHGQDCLQSNRAGVQHADCGDGILVDGGVHHPNPGEFSAGPAIVSKLGFASRFPDASLPLVDLGFHLLEMFWSMALDWYFSDPEDHIVIRSGLPDVGCLSFGVSSRKCRQMVHFGYYQSRRVLRESIATGAVPVRDQ